MLSSVWRLHFHTFRFDSEHNSCTVCLFRHTHTPCTCRCNGSTVVASLTDNSSIYQPFLRCFVPFLPCQQLFIIEGSIDEDGINSSPENGYTFAHHNRLTNASTACWAFYCLLGILLLARHSTACSAFYCFSDVPSCWITYAGLTLPGLRHKVFSRRRFFRYNNEFWSWIDCCCSARYGVHIFTSSVSTRSKIRARSASSDTHTHTLHLPFHRQHGSGVSQLTALSVNVSCVASFHSCLVSSCLSLRAVMMKI